MKAKLIYSGVFYVVGGFLLGQGLARKDASFLMLAVFCLVIGFAISFIPVVPDE